MKQAGLRVEPTLRHRTRKAGNLLNNEVGGSLFHSCVSGQPFPALANFLQVFTKLL